MVSKGKQEKERKTLYFKHMFCLSDEEKLVLEARFRTSKLLELTVDIGEVQIVLVGTELKGSSFL